MVFLDINPMSIQVETAFAVPFVSATLPNSTRFNDELRRIFIEKTNAGVTYANPNPYTQRNAALFESNFDLFSWPEPAIQKLKAFCCNMLLETVAKLNQYDVETMQKLRLGADAWFHVTRRHGYFGIHNHPMASWSGVYCVKAGTHDADQPNSGVLSFLNPFVLNTMFVDAGTAQLAAPFNMLGKKDFRLEEGQIVLFPSWLLHEVKPFLGDDERITVAFNAWFHFQQ
jgi:uncharacterized protein (TIGR02466 family)